MDTDYGSASWARQGESHRSPADASPASYEGLPQTWNYGPVYNITADNVFSGVNYGSVTNMISDDEEFLRSLPSLLKVSFRAEHGYYHELDNMRRNSCTPGTRVPIIEPIMDWATNTSPDSALIYWLSGQGGVGKTAIAHTICDLLETPVSGPKGTATLGACFFCSRQYLDTRSASAIIRTIVYQLALRSKPFRTALKEQGRFETVHHGPRSQIMGLLIEPWRMSVLPRLAGNEPCYVILIDAPDELDGLGGTEFLATLFDVLEKENPSGLKFLLTSRSDPALVKRITSFPDKQVCRLEEVPLLESSADIKIYLDKNLGECATTQQVQQLVSEAAGLFIYAATVVEYVRGRVVEEQQVLLARLLRTSSPPLRIRGATARLDQLYLQILESSLIDPRDQDDPEVHQDCLSILHTFLCTIERTSAAVAVHILNASVSEPGAELHISMAEGVLRRLHAVLYRQGDKVMSFHKSFSDFLFEEARSQRYFCDQHHQHQRLAIGCFGVMGEKLQFNILDTPSSCQLDRDDPTLSTNIETKISKPLRYASGNWIGHLTFASSLTQEITETLSKFLRLQVLFWMELMNLLGQRGRCHGMLRSAQRWVGRDKDQAHLLRELADAASFALYHSTSGGSLSTPHLYRSSLATFHRHSALVQHWRQTIGGIPTFMSAHRATGEALMASFPVEGHATAFAVSADGGSITSGSADGTLAVWDLSTGEKVKTLKGQTGGVCAMAYSPSGTHVTTGSDNKLVQVWDLSSGEVVHIFQGHAGGVRAVAYSPDGSHIVSGSFDKSVRLWDLSTGQEVRVFRDHRRRVCTVAFSPDGRMVASGSDDGLALLWDLSLGGQPKVFRGHTGGVHAVSFSPDGTHVTSGSSDHSVRVWSVSTGQQVATFWGHTGPVCSLAYYPDGTLVASGSSDQSIRIWDISTGLLVASLEGHRGSICTVAYSLDGDHIISGSADQSVRVWDSSAVEEETAPKGHDIKVNSLAYSPRDNHVVCGMEDASVWVWDLSSGEVLKSLKGHTQSVQAVAYSSDGAYAASCSGDESIRIWDMTTGEEAMALEGHSDKVWAVAYSPDGDSIASASSDRSVKLWDVSSGEEVKTLTGHADWVQTVAYSPKGVQLASGSKDKLVKVWDLASGRAVKTLQGHLGAINAVAYSPSGTHVISASADKTFRVWDLGAGAGVKVLEGHTGGVTAVCCSPDGTRIVSGSDDKSIRVWELATGVELMILKGHMDAVTGVTWSPNGQHVASCSLDTSVRVWDVSPQHRQRFVRQKGSNGEYTGWLISPTDPSVHLMFIPPESLPPDDTNVLTLPASAASHVDFSNVHIGHGRGVLGNELPVQDEVTRRREKRGRALSWDEEHPTPKRLCSSPYIQH